MHTIMAPPNDIWTLEDPVKYDSLCIKVVFEVTRQLRTPYDSVGSNLSLLY